MSTWKINSNPAVIGYILALISLTQKPYYAPVDAKDNVITGHVCAVEY